MLLDELEDKRDAPLLPIPLLFNTRLTGALDFLHPPLTRTPQRLPPQVFRHCRRAAPGQFVGEGFVLCLHSIGEWRVGKAWSATAARFGA